MSHHVRVTGRRPHTKSYSQENREILGLAFARARESNGWSRPAFSRLSGVGKTSLYKLETGIAVGPTVYEAAARALPGWTEATPKIILDGGPIPSNESQPEPAASNEGVDEANYEDIWSPESLLVFEALEAIARSRGKELDEATIADMRAFAERKRRNRPAETVVTPHDGSHEDSE